MDIQINSWEFWEKVATVITIVSIVTILGFFADIYPKIRRRRANSRLKRLKKRDKEYKERYEPAIKENKRLNTEMAERQSRNEGGRVVTKGKRTMVVHDRDRK